MLSGEGILKLIQDRATQYRTDAQLAAKIGTQKQMNDRAATLEALIKEIKKASG